MCNLLCLLFVSLILSGCSSCSKPVVSDYYITVGAGFLSDTTIWMLGISNSEYSTSTLTSDEAYVKDLSYELYTLNINNSSVLKLRKFLIKQDAFSVKNNEVHPSYAIPKIAHSNRQNVVVAPFPGIDSTCYVLSFDSDTLYQLNNVLLKDTLLGISSEGNWLLLNNKIVNINTGESEEIIKGDFSPFYMNEAGMTLYGIVDSFLVKHSMDDNLFDTLRLIENVNFRKKHAFRMCYSGEVVTLQMYSRNIAIQEFETFLLNDSIVLAEFSASDRIFDFNMSTQSYLVPTSNGIKVINFETGETKLIPKKEG